MDILMKEMRTENILNDFLNDNGFVGIDVIIDGSEWAYDEDARIVYGNIESLNPVADEMFMAYCYENGLEWDCPVFIMSFLHEVYHDLTRELFDDFTWDITDIYVRLAEMMKPKISSQDLWNYFNSPRERTATVNAIFYANDYREILEELVEELKYVLV